MDERGHVVVVFHGSETEPELGPSEKLRGSAGSVGTLGSPSNMRRQWRDFRTAHDYEAWITPKTFRKAVATLIRDDVDLDTAAAQLGHSSTAVTARHYTARVAEGPDVTAILERFGAAS